MPEENIITIAIDECVERLSAAVASETAAIMRIQAVYPMPELADALDSLDQAERKLKVAACRSMQGGSG